MTESGPMHAPSESAQSEPMQSEPMQSEPMQGETVQSEPMQTEAKQPWYKSIWPFSRKEEQVAAPAPAPGPAPAPTAAAGRSDASAARGEFVFDRPNRALRTGVLGECVKTGRWSGEADGAECPGEAPTAAPMPAPVAVVEPAPQPAPPSVQPEPVEVQPLMTEPMEDARALVPAPSPPPEPEVVAPAPPPPPPVPAPAKQTTTLSADALFAINSYQLKPTAKARLDEFAAQLDEFSYQSIRIMGHTDPTGSAGVNERLSLARANSVKRYLMSRGVPASKIETKGMGSSIPMVTDKDCAKLPRSQRAACYQPDRRVEIEVSGVKMSRR
jgi:outer membrane protein OmpA-like peptidoglycan-associated protein